MHILVINPGSSSIKFSVFAEDGGEVRSMAEGELGGIGGRAAKLEFRDAGGNDLSGKLGDVSTASMEDAIGVVERAVEAAGLPAPDAVGYRVVHPGAHMRGHQRVTAEVLAQLRAAVVFAPLHDPEALEVIEELMRRFPAVPHIACFDTVFHETMPEEATVYALPAAVRGEGVRRYGFHGLSCESVVWQMKRAAGVEFPRSMLIAHLGSGLRSVTACVDQEIRGHHHGNSANGRCGDGNADGRHRSGSGDLPDAAGGRDGGFGGGDAEPRSGAEGAGRGQRYEGAACGGAQ